MCLRHAIDSNGDSTEWICTGGDDQDLVITGVQAKQNELILLAQKRLSNTHSAAIQALCIIPIDGDNNSDDGFILAAASIDQRLNFWLVNGGKEIDKACLLHSMMFSVADVCAMDIITCNDGSLLITLVGVGMQQIRLSLSAEEVKKGNPRWKPTDTSERRIDI
jgi:hypothetical protein